MENNEMTLNIGSSGGSSTNKAGSFFRGREDQSQSLDRLEKVHVPKWPSCP